MKMIVLGCCGMAGHIISQYMMEQGRQADGFARRKSPVCKTYTGDAVDFDKIGRIILEEKYDVVINCLGVLNKSVDEDLYRGIMINSALPQYLDKLCEKNHIYFVHLSTDCVFDGKKGRYAETDIPNALSRYGMSKALGETGGASLCIRTSLIAPDMNVNGIGLFNWFYKQDSAEGYSNVIWSGVSVIELARFIEFAISNKLSGIFHLTNNTEINKYDLLRLFNEYKPKNKILIKENPVPCSNKSLINTREDVDYKVSSYECMVKEMYEWIYGHKGLYPHYIG